MTPLVLLVTFACTGSGQPFGVRGPGATDDPQTPADTSVPGQTTRETGTSETSSSETGDVPVIPPRLFVYVGSGDDRIRVYTMDPATGTLVWQSEIDGGPSPSFLAFSPDGNHLYAANEGSDQVSAFTIDRTTGALGFQNRVSSNGGGPAHVAVDATGQWVFAANYGGGTVTMIEVAGDGSLGSARATLGTGPNAHQLVVDPSNRFVFVPNLGADDVSQLVFDAGAGTLVENAVPRVDVASGAGPRHLVFHPTAPFAYLIDETDDTMVSLAFDGSTGRLSPIQTLSTLPVGVSGADSYCAEVAFGASGRFLYGSNRGHDTIVIFEVDPVTGSMTWTGEQDTGGDWPRHFSIDPTGQILLVGNQHSDTIVSFRIDEGTGQLTQLATLSVPGPAFVGVTDLPL